MNDQENVEASSLGLTQTNVGNGLVPKSGTALFASTSGDITANYDVAGPSVPIYVEYRLIPGATAPSGAPITWASAVKATTPSPSTRSTSSTTAPFSTPRTPPGRRSRIARSESRRF